LSFIRRPKTAEFNYWLLLYFANWSKSDRDDAVHTTQTKQSRM